MKFLIANFLTLLIAVTLAHENYNGPEYAPFDASSIIPIQDMPGFWDGRDFPAAFTNPIARNRRIVDGEEVEPHSHPYQVALFMNFMSGTGFCSGSLLTVRSVLTAAHCPIGSISILVIAGVHNRNQIEANQQRRTVPEENYRIHPNYNPANLNNDIAILITPTPDFLLTEAVQLVRRPTGDQLDDMFVGERARSTGWGHTPNTGGVSGVLRMAYNYIIANEVCAALYGTSIVFDGVLCTETAPSDQRICVGDTGSILSVERPPGAPVQVGVNSFGTGAGCAAGFPTGFGRVSFHDAWISNNLNP